MSIPPWNACVYGFDAYQHLYVCLFWVLAAYQADLIIYVPSGYTKSLVFSGPFVDTLPSHPHSSHKQLEECMLIANETCAVGEWEWLRRGIKAASYKEK